MYFGGNIVTMLKQKSYVFCADIESISVTILSQDRAKPCAIFNCICVTLEGKIAANCEGFSCPNLRNFDAKDDAKLSSDLQNERSENDPN